MSALNETMGAYGKLFMLLATGTWTMAVITFACNLAKRTKTSPQQPTSGPAPLREREDPCRGWQVATSGGFSEPRDRG